MALLEASGIGKNFGETKVLATSRSHWNRARRWRSSAPSGSGKTTSLQLPELLERPDTGVIKVNGETMWDAADPPPSGRARCGKSASTSASCSRTSTSSPVHRAGKRDAGGGAWQRSSPATRPTKRPSTPSWKHRPVTCWPRWACRSGQATTPPALRRSAAGGHRPRTGAPPGHPLLR